MSTIIVSAYYKIPSKQPHSFYTPHLRRWFQSVRAPVIFFTTADVRAEVESWRYPLSHVQFVELPFTELRAWTHLGPDFWNRQKSRDPETYHTPELGAVWYEKKEFVARALDLVPDASIFIWCDAGCIRNETAAAAAHTFGTRAAIAADDTRLHVQYAFPSTTNRYYRYPYRCIAGAIMAGTRIAWQQHSELYDDMLARYDEISVCGMSDQYVIKSCMDEHPDVYCKATPSAGDPWFFFLWTL